MQITEQKILRCVNTSLRKVSELIAQHMINPNPNHFVGCSYVFSSLSFYFFHFSKVRKICLPNKVDTNIHFHFDITIKMKAIVTANVLSNYSTGVMYNQRSIHYSKYIKHNITAKRGHTTQ